MRLFKIILSICFLINVAFVAAQDKCKVLVTNTDKSIILLKWYSENIYFDQPVYVFRQGEGSNSWVLISQKPISKGIAIPDNIVEKDKILGVLQNKVLVTKASDLDGMTKLILMIKSVQYPELSKFLGIQFIDSGVSRGNKYRYMISYSSVDTGKQIGLSDWIVAADYIPVEAPAEIKTTQEGNSLHFSWKPDEDKFMGVYIYRAIKGQDMVRITSVPALAGVDEEGNYTEFFYTDDSLVTGNEYIYTLKSIDYFGRESNESPKISVKIKDMEPPLAPDKLVCNTEGKIVSIYWENENVPDLAGYKIYRTIANDTVFTCITPNILLKEKNIYIDTLSDIGVYNYRVAAIDDSGNEALSEIYPVEINDVFPPSTPQSLVAVADVGKIVLSWQACKDDDIMGYCVYRSIGPESAFLLLNSEPVKTTTFTDNLPVNAKNEFVYKVVAVDLAYNRSDYSELALSRMPDVSAPEKPIIKTIKQDKNALVIEWYSNSETDLKGYHVYRYDEKSGFEQAQRINNKIIHGITMFTDQFPEPGIKYNYYLIACDSSNNLSVPSDIRTARIFADNKATDLVNSFTAKYNKRTKSVNLSWKVSEQEEIKSFIVYRKMDETENFKPISGNIKKTEFSDKIDKDEGVFYYRISVITKSNNIQYSKTETITIKQ